MKTVFFLVGIFIFTITGCSSHKGSFVREDLESQIWRPSGQKPDYEEHEIEKIFAKKVNLPKPFSIAVYFKQMPEEEKDHKWRWTLEEKQFFLNAVRESIGPEVVTQIFLMDERLADQQDLRSIRLAAAKYRADSVLVVEGRGDVWMRLNKWATSYLLVLPSFFVHGNTLEAYFSMNASLWDVRNEVLYMSFSSEGEDKTKYPALFAVDSHDYFTKTKKMALSQMQQSLKDNFIKMKR